MVAQNGNGDLAIPPTIQALPRGQARLVVPDERTAIECAAIQGQEFDHYAPRGSCPALSARLVGIQQSLVRKDSSGRPARTRIGPAPALWDAAYESLPKEKRADLHERFAQWLEVAVPEVEEIRGYHLEQAYRYRAELGPSTSALWNSRAEPRDCSQQQKATRVTPCRCSATIHLPRTAVSLLPDGDREAVALYPDLGTALMESGDLRRPEHFDAERLGDEDDWRPRPPGTEVARSYRERRWRRPSVFSTRRSPRRSRSATRRSSPMPLDT